MKFHKYWVTELDDLLQDPLPRNIIAEVIELIEDVSIQSINNAIEICDDELEKLSGYKKDNHVADIVRSQIKLIKSRLILSKEYNENNNISNN